MQSDSADRPEADWYGMREAAQSSPSVFRSLLEQYKATASPVIAGWLIGVITHCRRHGPVQPEEAIAALIELTKSLKVWELGQTPTGLLAALHSAIYENGLPVRADYEALAEFIWQAAFQHYGTFKGPRHDLDVDIINLCAILARRDQLIPVLTTRPRLREEMIPKLESMIQRLATEDKDLYDSYGPDGNFAIQSLRPSDNSDFLERPSRANIGKAKRILKRAGRGRPPVAGDER
jgi:hypothetical protein